MLCLFPTVDTSLSVAIDTLGQAWDLLRLREESDWPIPERDIGREPAAVRDPLDLNATPGSELGTRLDLQPSEVERIIAVRDSLGAFRSLSDLRFLGTGLQQRLMKMRSKFRLSREPPGVAIRLRTSLSRREPEEQCWVSPWKTYLRGSLGISRKMRVGVLGEKDPGEPYRYAFGSAYLLVERLGVLQRLILGDYTVHAGQGLVIGRGGGFRRVLPVRESAMPAPHAYADESGFFRGLALASEVAGVQGVLFWSAMRRAASRDEDGELTNLDDSGLFRTPGEQASWGSVKEMTLGAVLRALPHRDAEIGLAVYRTHFSQTLLLQGGQPLQRVEGVGLNWRLQLDGSWFEGELGRLMPGGPVFAACWVLPLGRGGSFLFGLRHYAPSSPGLFCSAPGRGGVSANEQGGTLSFAFSPFRSCEVEASLDLCRELWRTQRTPLPRRFEESSLRVKMLLSPGTECALRWRWLRGSERIAGEDILGRSSWDLALRQRHSLQLTLRHSVGRLLSTDARIELVDVRWQGCDACDRGWLLSQTITLMPVPPLSVVGRIAVARTSSYTSRIYLPEHDHSGSAGFVMLYGSAVRYYLLVRAATPWGLRISFKYSSSYLDPPAATEYRPGQRLRYSLISVQLDGSW